MGVDVPETNIALLAKTVLVASIAPRTEVPVEFVNEIFMTFDEAVEAKKLLPEYIYSDGYKLRILIFPDQEDDFQRYIEKLPEYFSGNINDETALLFSRNQIFVLVKVAYDYRGVHLYHRVKIIKNNLPCPY